MTAPGISGLAGRKEKDRLILRDLMNIESPRKDGRFSNAEHNISEATLNGRECLRDDFKMEGYISRSAPGMVLSMEGYDYTCIIRGVPGYVLNLHQRRLYPKNETTNPMEKEMEAFIKGVKMSME